MAKRRKTNWAQVEFAEKSDVRLAFELGMGLSTVSRHRRSTTGKSSSGIPPPFHKMPLGLLKDSVIAAKYNLTVAAIRAERERRGIAKVVYPSKTDWMSLDWNHTSTEIAQELGVSRQWISWKRKQLGIPGRPPGRPKKEGTSNE